MHVGKSPYRIGESVEIKIGKFFEGLDADRFSPQCTFGPHLHMLTYLSLEFLIRYISRELLDPRRMHLFLTGRSSFRDAGGSPLSDFGE
jgi:hypothetical protein